MVHVKVVQLMTVAQIYQHLLAVPQLLTERDGTLLLLLVVLKPLLLQEHPQAPTEIYTFN